MPIRPGLTYYPSENSSVEDFRSVIDDLTIANKRLKQRLRKYEKLYDSHLQDEKLFEVRIHGLPDHKKKELEETLRKFAADLEGSPESEYPQGSFAATLEHRGASSLTSRFAESGYASISGQQSSLATGGQESSSGSKPAKVPFDRNQQNVRSYLHDIPVGLLPRQSAPLSEKAKKKLVVRRLEQIFSGKQSAPGKHSHPEQQEEVAQMAATADRQEREASGAAQRKEGVREARIMHVEGARAGRGDAEGEGAERDQPVEPSIERSNSGSGSPDQRPTRPLDLDPFRAQVPSDNMDYIRHLGFTPPDMTSEDSPEEGHGWIYLNLLINMAQLHTINVTPDFVKDAVTEYSSKFELSRDGRKIRWKGGHGVTRTSSDSSSEQLDGISSSKGKSPLKPSLADHSDSTESLIDADRQARRIARAMKEADQNKFIYTPMFFHKEDSDEEDNFYNELVSSNDSPAHPHAPKDPSSGIASSTMRSSSSRKRRDDGPIIFYKAKFCTDLSGDQVGAPLADQNSYNAFPTQPLGVPLSTSSDSSSSMLEAKGPLRMRPMQLEKGESPKIGDDRLVFSPMDLRNDTSDDSPETIEFEASGLGGVQPDDNFSIKVRREQFRTERHHTGNTRSTHQRSRLYPKHILDALERNQSSPEGEATSHPVISARIVSASHKNLPSSELPPASFLPFDSTSSGDVDSDLESDISSSPSISASVDPETSDSDLHLRNISSDHLSRPTPAVPGNDYETSDGDLDGDGDLSLPDVSPASSEGVHFGKLEFDPSLAGQLAEEIPAGSSAATAGGGSGFNSPDSVKEASVGSAKSKSKSPKLKRARTSDSIAAAMPGKAQKLD